MPLLLLRRLLPVVVLISTALYCREPAIGLSSEYQQLLNWLPYATIGISMLLCINYNHARLFTVSLALLVIYYFIQTELQTSLSEPRTLFIYTSISVLLPLMLLISLFLPERGMRNRYGVLISAVVPILFIIAHTVFKMVPEANLVMAMNNYFKIRPFDNYLLSINVSIFYCMAFVVGIYHLCKTNNEYFMLSYPCSHLVLLY